MSIVDVYFVITCYNMIISSRLNLNKMTKPNRVIDKILVKINLQIFKRLDHVFLPPFETAMI